MISVSSEQDRESFAEIIESSIKYREYTDNKIHEILECMKEEFPSLEEKDIFSTYFFHFCMDFLDYICKKILGALMRYDQKEDSEENVNKELEYLLHLYRMFGEMFSIHITSCMQLTFSFYKRPQEMRVGIVKEYNERQRNAKHTDYMYNLYDTLQHMIYEDVYCNVHTDFKDLEARLLKVILECDAKDYASFKEPSLNEEIYKCFPLSYDFLEYAKFKKESGSNEE